MNLAIMVIYTVQEDYGRGLMEYLSRGQELPFQIYAFASEERFQDYMTRHSVQLILVDKELAEKVKETSAKVIYLVEDHSGDEGICRYQSAREIARQILRSYGQMEDAGLFSERGQMEIYGIYTPASHPDQIVYALALAKKLAGNHRLLYLNLHQFSGFEQLFHTFYKQDLMDILYFLGDGREELLSKLAEVVCSYEGVDYIPPPFLPGDLGQVTLKEWQNLLENLESGGGYDRILIDMGDGIPCFLELLDNCREIYLPYREAETDRARVNHYETVLEKLGKIELLKRTKKVKQGNGGTTGNP